MSAVAEGSLVLIVEDDREIGALMRDFLEADGFAVANAETASTALRAIDLDAPDCVLLDIMLPDDGLTDALNTLIGLDRDRNLLERKIAAVDLRLADRVSVRLRDANEPATPDGGVVAPDVPTASTKRNT